MSDQQIDQREKFHELLKKFRSVMLVTRNVDGANGSGPGLHGPEFSSRPMAIARVDESCDLWFLTDVDSAKVLEIRVEPQVHIVAQDDEARFLSLSGTASVSNDRTLIDELWSEPDKVWWPDGSGTPSIRVIKVSAQEGDYWDTTGLNKVNYLLRAAKAYVTGTTPNTEKGKFSGHVSL